MFQRGSNLLHRRLTKLYSDTKQSYASANVTQATTNLPEDPEILDIRRQYQIQQDRLLAWGYDWTETNAAEVQGYAGGEVEIDKRLDQAGLTDLVAGVMSEIQKLLDESRRLQQADRYTRVLRSPKTGVIARKQESTTQQTKTARSLLEQLTTRIDVLYSLSQSRRTLSQEGDADRKPLLRDAETGSTSSQRGHETSPSLTSRKRSREDDDNSPTLNQLEGHPLFIPFEQFTFLAPTHSDSIDPPPYEETRSQKEERCLANMAKFNCSVLLIFVPLTTIDFEDDSSLPALLNRIHILKAEAEKLSSAHELSYQGHLPFVGFTAHWHRSRLGFAYRISCSTAMPRVQKSLTDILWSSLNRAEPSTPCLENRYRIAYNIVLALLGYFKNRTCHASLSSLNILYLFENSADVNPKQWDGIRSPILAPIPRPLEKSHDTEWPFPELMYHHPMDNVHTKGRLSIPAFAIYSLGLILLEIGLWMPIAKFWKSKYDRRSFSDRVSMVYVHNLASKCGNRYMRAVQRCLSAPAQLNSAEIEGNLEGIFVDANAFLLNIAQEMRTCCVLDDSGPPPSTDLEYFQADSLPASDLPQITDSERDVGQDSSMLDAPPTPMSLPDNDERTVRRDSNSLSKATVRERSPGPNLRKFPDIDIPQAHLDEWNMHLMPRLSKILQSALKGSPESCSVSLMMVGSNPESARTTICIQCHNTMRVEAALRQRFRPKRGWGVVILRGQIKRSGRRRKPGKRQQKQEAAALAQNKKLREQYFQERPVSGASIGAFKNGEHLPPVSFGGTILVDGEPFGMTVHHMLDDVSDDEDDINVPLRSAAPRKQIDDQVQRSNQDFLFMQVDEQLDTDPDFGELSLSGDSDSDTSTIRPDYSAFDEDGNEFWFLEDPPENDPGLQEDEGSESESSEGDEDTASLGDAPGIDPLDEDETPITQPAIDDVDEDFFPNEEDRDEDHLDSHSFGFVHASSGIRRLIIEDVKHEVDWALIKVHENRLRLDNQIMSDLIHPQQRQTKSGKLKHSTFYSEQQDGSEKSPNLAGVTPSQKLGGTEVHCCGRSSGFRKGKISQAMALVKLHGRHSFSSSWCVEGGFGGLSTFL